MSAPVSFQRIYADHGPGPEYPATPEYVANVLRSMNACGELNPFKVRLRFGDGSVVIVKPKRGGRLAQPSRNEAGGNERDGEAEGQADLVGAEG